MSAPARGPVRTWTLRRASLLSSAVSVASPLPGGAEPPPLTAPSLVLAPSIDGVAEVGQTLALFPGAYSGNPIPNVTYQWERDGAAISGAAGDNYLLVSADLGTTITATVTAANSEGLLETTTNSLGPITDAVVGADIDAPVLTLTSTPGDVPPRWQAVYPNAILGRDWVRMNYRINAGAWQVTADHELTEEDLINGEFDWPEIVAETFAAGDVVDIRERIVRDLGAPEEALSLWSDIISDTIEDAIPNAFGFSDQTGVEVSSLVTSDAISVLGIDPGVNAPASLDVGEYELNASGVWLPAGDFTVALNDTIRLRHTAAGFSATSASQTLTINGVSDTFTSTTGSSGAGFAASTAQPATVNAGSATWANIDFEDGTAVAFVGPHGGTTALETSVTLDGAAMTLRGTIGTPGSTPLMSVYTLDGVTAGLHTLFVDRTNSGNTRAMCGTLLNGNSVPSDLVGETYSAHTNNVDASAPLDINANGIGVVMIAKPGFPLGSLHGGMVEVAQSPDGNQRLCVMSVTGTPGFDFTGSGTSGLIAAAFDKAP